MIFAPPGSGLVAVFLKTVRMLLLPYPTARTTYEIAAIVVIKKRIAPRHPFFGAIRTDTLNGSDI